MTGWLSCLKENILFFLNNYNDVTLLEWHFKHAGRLERFRDIHAGQDCFVIGNGPSLRGMDLSLLNGYHLFGLNKIYLLFDRLNLNLSYHVAVNSLVIEQSIKEFESLACPSFLSYRAASPWGKCSDNFFFLATVAPCSFYHDITKPVYEGYTVTYVTLQIAFFMGFRRVFLIGVDHSFSCQGNPNEQKYLEGEDPNHFDPNYFANKEWHLPDLEASELSYQMARFFYSRDQRQIIDATVGGKLQVFPKTSFEAALQLCRKKEQFV